MKNEIEAILFAAGRYLELGYIAKLLQADLRTVRKAMNELREEYEKRDGAITLVQENDSFKLQVKDQYLEYAAKLAGEIEIAKTVLETLAVVAWKNGISQAELIKIRGPAAYDHIGELVERGFLSKTPEGRSFKLVLQQKFFDYFDVEGREDMKKLFAPIEQDAATAQAEIDAKQAEYDERARAAQEALVKGSTRVSVAPTGSAPSAQEDMPDLLADAQKLPAPPNAEASGPDRTTPQNPTGADAAKADFAAAEQAIKEFGKELGDLKRELAGKPVVHHKQKKNAGVYTEMPDDDSQE